MLKVMTIVGTRPELIRLSRVIARLDATVDHVLVHTGQNYDFTLNEVFFQDLGIRKPDHLLGVDTSSLGHVLGETLIRTEEVLLAEKPDAVLVLGDTNSCIAALMAKRMRISVYHMEAGNRCVDENVPEETNRRMVDHVADFNLVYTEHARRNLLAEGLHPRGILLTGSPMREVLDAYRPQIEASTARWLTAALTGAGYEVDIYDLANSRRDPNSRRVVSPASWFRSTLLSPDATDPQVIHVGSNGAEFEPLRYLGRSELTSELEHHDVIQVVAGGPALGLATTGSRRPVILLVATRVAWERASQLADTGRVLAWWRGSMTRVVSLMERLAVRRAAAVLVLNDDMHAYVVATGQPNALLAPPGVNTDMFSPAATGWNAAGYLLSVCRLSDPRKGLNRLVRAYALIRAARPHTPNMVLAWRGVIPRALNDLINALALHEFIEIRSDVPEADLPKLYQSASVYVQCSHEEGLGISVIQAMASGAPVVGTDTAGTRQTILDGETGWLIEQGSDVERLTADRVIAILDDDNGLMAKRARERAVAIFSNDVTISRLLAIYNDTAHGDSWRY